MKPTIEQWQSIYNKALKLEGEPFSTEEVVALGKFVDGLVAKDSTRFATGAEIKDFWDNGWPVDCYHDDSEYEIEDENGNWTLQDDEKYELALLGSIIQRGGDSSRDERTMSFEQAFNEWKRVKS